MRITKKLGLTTIVCVLGLTLIGGFSARGAVVDRTAPREWRAVGGFTFTAEFVELKGDTVVLKAADGSLRNILLHLLVAEDQALAKEWGTPRVTSVGAFATKPGSGNLLATFTEGPAKGNFAWYENDKFSIRVTPTAGISIQPLEDGKPVGKRIRLSLGHAYKPPKASSAKLRPIVSFSEAYPPLFQSDVMALEGILEGNIPFGFTLTIEGQSIHVSAWVDDPSVKVHSENYLPAFYFDAYRTFEAHVLVTEQKELLKEFSIEVTPLKGKTFTLPYGDVVKGCNMPLRKFEIKGPIFGSRRVSVSAGPSRAGEMFVRFNFQGTPVSGFRLGLQKQNYGLNDPLCRMTLTID